VELKARLVESGRGVAPAGEGVNRMVRFLENIFSFCGY